MTSETETYFVVEPDGDYRSDLKRETEFPVICWESNGFGVCIEDWSNDEIKVGLYVAGIRVATKTLKANDPCVSIDEGGDLGRIRARVCAEFPQRRVVASGRVCTLGVCIRFSQVVYQW